MPLKKHLKFSSLRTKLSEVFNTIPDFRQLSKVSISLHDALMSAFACMHFQDRSLLQFQRRMEEEQSQNNLETLFKVEKLPKETQMRELVDEISSEHFRPIFKDFYSRLQRGKYLEAYQIFPKQYYFPIDGSQFYSSKEIHCDQCLVKHHKKGSPTYSHQVLQGGIMHPDCKEVIPFMPEQIVNSDGSTKQDCEMNAAKRFVQKLRKDFPQLDLVLGGDALFSKQPLIEMVVKLRFHYIFAAKPTDHTYLFNWLDTYNGLHEVDFIDDKERHHYYEWMNEVPLNGQKDAVLVNFFRCRVVGKNKKGEDVVVFHNSWVTDKVIDESTIKDFVRAGRCRWKNENECFNVMKNHGYEMEHNYGHGKKNLAFNFYLLTLLAFFFHQIAELSDSQYQACRKKFGSKIHLWETLRAYISLLLFDTWERLMEFALTSKKSGLVQWSGAP